jgi:Protein of unknown function (DUF1048)
VLEIIGGEETYGYAITNRQAQGGREMNLWETVTGVLGDDIKGFCAALADGEGARSYRDRWREQLNKNVTRKLGRLGG